MSENLKKELEIIYEDYKRLYGDCKKLEKENEYLMKRDNKLQLIEQIFESEPIDLKKLKNIVKEII